MRHAIAANARSGQPQLVVTAERHEDVFTAELATHHGLNTRGWYGTVTANRSTVRVLVLEPSKPSLEDLTLLADAIQRAVRDKFVRDIDLFIHRENHRQRYPSEHRGWSRW
jgi:divalent metal cation (Fe/Co/Zn/Cd) transporter